MSLSFERYVDITSGVGGTSSVRQRELIGRLFTTNELLPTGSIIEFTSADDVSAYFGSTSEEYKRSAFYFGYISKNITSPSKISFARWADVDTAPQIFGDVADYSLSTFTSITSGEITITLGADTNTITGLDFSSDLSLSDVATTLQTAIRLETGTMWTAATVVYNATRKSFDLEGGDTGAAIVSVASGAVATAFGWETGALFSNGVVTETITEVLSISTELSNNFFGFLFQKTLTSDEVVEVATWNDPQNVKFMYCVPVDASNYSSISSSLLGLSGNSLTLQLTEGEYAEMVPMMQAAATNYSKVNSTINFMFKDFDLTPSVTTNLLADVYDAARINYYGQTQTAGVELSFYQRGIMTGGSTDPVSMNVYTNEAWLKDTISVRIMDLLLALAKVSANTKGVAQILAVIQDSIQQALDNGTISVGKDLNITQKLYIANATNDENAWMQVQQQGYWIDGVIESYVTTGGVTEYKFVYTLIYSKDDVVRKVEGSDVLI